MATSFFALFDDIASILDDVATMTKVAAKKTAGVLGDDLALNAEQVSGVRVERELPVVLAVAKGSLKNKAILVPGALLISASVPWLITPLLMLGGAYLCYEGFEKLAHKFLHPADEDSEHHQQLIAAVADPSVDLVAFEADKIRGAIRTDFVLSAEIIVISLGTVADKAFARQVPVLISIALLMTLGVYGLVAAIVKLDDLGLYLARKPAALWRALGHGLVRAAPYLMKTLSVVGTVAMFMVGGGILAHGIGPLQHSIEQAAEALKPVPGLGSVLAFLTPSVLNAGLGVLAGALVLFLVQRATALVGRAPADPS